MRIAIVEDQAAERSRVREYAESYFSSKGIETEFFLFEDGIFLLEKYPRQLDLIFLDIEMKYVDGLRTAKSIREFDEQVQILFVTRMIQYALEGYAVNAADFLVKPLRYPVFCSCMDRVLRKMDTNAVRFLLTRQGREDVCCPINQITYVESLSKKTILHRKAQEDIQSSETLALLEEKLKEEPFFRCHKSYLVNLNHIQNIEVSDLMVDGQKIPISKHRRKDFLQALANHKGRML